MDHLHKALLKFSTAQHEPSWIICTETCLNSQQQQHSMSLTVHALQGLEKGRNLLIEGYKVPKQNAATSKRPRFRVSSLFAIAILAFLVDHHHHRHRCQQSLHKV